MEKLSEIMTKGLEVFLVILMVVMVLDVTWQVFTRFILKDPSSFTEELAGFLLIWIGLLGASYALYTRAHLGIDVLTAKLKGAKKRLSEISIYVIVVLFSLFILVIGGLLLVNLTFTLNQVSPAMCIPMAYVYLVLPITGILMIFYSSRFIYMTIRQQPVITKERQVSAID